MTEFTVLTSETLLARIAGNREIILLDVRDPYEYVTRHIPGSVLLPFDELSERHMDVLDCENEIVCICENGFLSVEAVEFLIEWGYENVAHLEGGMTQWTGKVRAGTHH